MIPRPVPCPVPHSALRALARPALAALLAGTTLLAPAAHAARMTISGEDLDLTIPCTGQVRVVVDPNMKDGATLDSSSMAQVAMHASKEEAESRISLSTKACAPNGKLTVSISPSTGLTIHDSHDTHFIITGKLASLDASLDSTTMDIENTQSLDLTMQGASSVHIKALERAAQIVASGTSTLTADTAQLAALSAQLTQGASMTLSGSSIDALTLITADQAGATILGHATVATVAANGTGEINIEAVSGPMVRSGKGTVHVGAQNGVIYRPTPEPPPAPQTPPPITAPVSPPVTAPATPPVTSPTAPGMSTPAPGTTTAPAPTTPVTPAPATPAIPQQPSVPTQAPTVTQPEPAAPSGKAQVQPSPQATAPTTGPTASATPQATPAPVGPSAAPVVPPQSSSTASSAPASPLPAPPVPTQTTPENPAATTPSSLKTGSQGE